MVLVTMRSAYDKVQSSWLAVHMAAMELNAACQDVRTAPGLGSAYTYLGNPGTLKISLTGPQRQLGDGSSETEANGTS